MKKLFGLFAAGAAVASLAACGGASKYESADFRWTDTAIATNLNSATVSVSTDFLILNNIGEGLVRRIGDEENTDALNVSTEDNFNYTIHDGLASAATKVVNPDGTVEWTFTLREGIKWSNGDAITAADFEFGWQQLANPANAGSYSSKVDMIVGGDEVRKGADLDELQAKALENGQFQVTLTKEVPYFLNLMSFEAFLPIHEATWNAAGGSDGYGKTVATTISSGPYVVTDWDSEYGIYLEKNEHYWDKDNVDLESISNRLMKDTTTAVLAYKDGDFDRVDLSGTQYIAEANNSERKVAETGTVWYMNVNLNSEVMADPYVREALSLSVDRESAVLVMQPYTAVSYFVPEGLATTHTDVDFRSWNATTEQYNTFVAQDLTAASAALNNTSSSYNNQSITFKAFELDSWRALINSVTYDMQTDLGANVTQSLQPSTGYYDEFDLNNGYLNYMKTVFDDEGNITSTTNPSGNWELGWYGWGPDYADPTTFLNLYRGDYGYNSIGLDQYDENSASTVWNEETSSYELSFTAATVEGNYNRVVTKDGKTAAEASAIYDGYLDAAEAALQSGSYDGYYNNLALAEAYLLDNHFIIPVAQRNLGYLLNDDFEGLNRHMSGSDYSWKFVSRK